MCSTKLGYYHQLFVRIKDVHVFFGIMSDGAPLPCRSSSSLIGFRPHFGTVMSYAFCLFRNMKKTRRVFLLKSERMSHVDGMSIKMSPDYPDFVLILLGTWAYPIGFHAYLMAFASIGMADTNWQLSLGDHHKPERRTFIDGLWMFMDVYGCLWMFVDDHRWFMDVYGCLWMIIDVCG